MLFAKCNLYWQHVIINIPFHKQNNYKKKQDLPSAIIEMPVLGLFTKGVYFYNINRCRNLTFRSRNKIGSEDIICQLRYEINLPEILYKLYRLMQGDKDSLLCALSLQRVEFSLI